MTAAAVKVDPIVIGIVKDLDDPQRLGRVRVAFPHLDDRLSDWARLATPMAGPDRGVLFRPEPEDEVLVAFVHGDPNQPYILGALWNEQDAPPEGGGETENNLRTIRSRSGHVLRFDDTSGAEKIEIISSSEQQRIVVDVAGPAVDILVEDGDVHVTASQGDIAIQADAGNVTVKAGSSMTLEGADVTMKASGNVTIQGAQVAIN